MSTGTNIEWTDATWVVTTGCTEASSGCANCYARVMSKRLRGMAAKDRAEGRDPWGKAAYSLAVADDGRWTGLVTPVAANLAEPLRWRKPRRVFVNSMSDLFWGTDKDLADARRRGVADPKPVPFEFIDRVFAVMALCPQHTFQVLTKRPERMAEYLSDNATRDRVDLEIEDISPQTITRWPLPNVWLGTSVEDQATADERIPHLLRCPAAVRFLSVEPMIGPVDLKRISLGTTDCTPVPGGPLDGVHTLNWYMNALTGAPKTGIPGLDWVIVGGESGPRARPCNVAWIRSIVAQCKEAGVPCFVKQLGAKPTYTDMKFYGGRPNALCSNGEPLKDPKGGDMAEWPQDLRVREVPRSNP